MHVRVNLPFLKTVPLHAVFLKFRVAQLHLLFT
jgi:hypothetical protein